MSLADSSQLTDMQITRVSLVDKGANARSFAVLKRGSGRRSARNVAKGQPTFATLQASREIRTWLPDALFALGQVIDAALAGDPSDPSVTPDLRLDAVRGSVVQFGDELLERVAASIVGEVAGAAAGEDVAKRSPAARWGGVL